MSNVKAIICTAAMTLMLVMILVGLVMLGWFVAFAAICGLFAAIGIALCSGKLYVWLSKDVHETEPEVPTVFGDVELNQIDLTVQEQTAENVDEIIREFGAAKA